MRKLGLTLAMVAGAVAPLAAQGMWKPEIGIRAGFTRFDDPNSDAHIDMIDIPGVGGFGAGAVNLSSLYGVIPIGDKIALRPTFGFYNVSVTGTTISTVSAGLRADFALTQDFYAGAGFNAYVVKQNGFEDTQGALEGAIGYRRAMGSNFRGSLEAFYEKREKSEALPELNAFGLRVGMGYAFGGETGGRRSGGRAAESMWKTSIGLQGGWSLVSMPDVVDITTFALPFAGQNLIAGSFVAPGPSALSVLFPVGEKMAFEPSLDVHSFKPDGSDRITTYQLGARMNYAFNRSAYGAFGVEYSGISANGIDDGSRLGALVAAGFRFPLTAGLSGRTELNYRVFDGNDVLPSGQATSFVFGLMVPVN
ncbi:MAG TPA: hypothetical protein VF454_07815 [Gemmatimonadales bacterium]